MILLCLYTFAFGAIIGSFLNVLILRIPIQMDYIKLQSHCPQCKSNIRWFENIPILSWIFLKGRCRQCHAPISKQYPLVEFITGVLFCLLAPAYWNLDSLTQYFILISIASCFLVHFIVDLRHHLLPNVINAYLALIFALATILQGRFLDGILGGTIGVLFPLLVTYFFYKLRGVIGLGGGDIKLYGALGLYLGFQGILFNIFLSCFLGALVGGSLMALKKISRSTHVPFGPFIIFVASIQIYFPHLFSSFIKFIF